MSETTTPAAAPAAAPTPAPDPSGLTGAAGVLPGKPVDEMKAALAAANPHAAEHVQANTAKRAERQAQVTALFQERFGVGDLEVANGGPLIPAARHAELARALKDTGFTFYVTVAASHWPAQKTKTGDEPESFEVATVLRSVGPGSLQVSWRVKLAPGEELDSLAPLFAGADWQEREQFDLVGVRFLGHPDLRRLMMPDEWEGHPLRRDYAIDTRCEPWR
ncbi:MAG: NADH-quinone oxidoreductase subunit C [Myxococcales bacterium]|nr:NADH-quinone oxidoreductase subunit C [Myxococcales bacterium]